MSYDPIEQFEHNGCTIKIYIDDDAPNPRKEYENVGKMVCFHNRYELGDEHQFKSKNYSSWGQVEAAIREAYDVAVLLPLGLFDHSGISMYIGSGAHPCDSGGWDSGQVGFIACTHEQVLTEWGESITVIDDESFTPLQMAEKYLRGEVETYNQYLTNEVYGYEIEGENGDEVDSCWGFFGFDIVMDEAKSACPKLKTVSTP
jgi:hypothetical protein